MIEGVMRKGGLNFIYKSKKPNINPPSLRIDNWRILMKKRLDQSFSLNNLRNEIDTSKITVVNGEVKPVVNISTNKDKDFIKGLKNIMNRVEDMIDDFYKIEKIKNECEMVKIKGCYINSIEEHMNNLKLILNDLLLYLG